MAWPLSLPARKNGRRLAHDAAPGDGEFDIHTLSAWAQSNLTREELSRVIAMLQAFLEKPDDADAKRSDVGGMDSRRRAASTKGFASRYPEASQIKRVI